MAAGRFDAGAPADVGPLAAPVWMDWLAPGGRKKKKNFPGRGRGGGGPGGGFGKKKKKKIPTPG